jgi:phosphoglycolate phosphatase-like HAD superfamily hydrolase
MFDLDGTLVDSTNVDSACYLQALVDIFGFDLDLIDRDWGNYPHVTDSGILQTLCQTELGRNPTIGDGIWDGVASGQLAYQFIGIGSGDRANDLRSHGAKHVFPHYQDLGAIMANLAE